jgi:hypothetical protein
MRKPFLSLTLALVAGSLPLLAEMKGFVNNTPHTWYLTPQVPARPASPDGTTSVIRVAVGLQGGPTAKSYNEVELRSTETTRAPIAVPPGTNAFFLAGRTKDPDLYPVIFKLWLPANASAVDAANVTSSGTVVMHLEGPEGESKTMESLVSALAPGGGFMVPSPAITKYMKNRKKTGTVMVAMDPGFQDAGYCFRENDNEEWWFWNLAEGKAGSTETTEPTGITESKGPAKPAGKCIVQ